MFALTAAAVTVLWAKTRRSCQPLQNDTRVNVVFCLYCLTFIPGSPAIPRGPAGQAAGHYTDRTEVRHGTRLMLMLLLHSLLNQSVTHSGKKFTVTNPIAMHPGNIWQCVRQ